MSTQPYIKQPVKSVPFPPPTYLKVHRVQTGENWWTLQEKYGCKDVWDLIRFNFGTQNPDEVNWCLKNLVGCKLTTGNGKNYRFSSDATPGRIYVPPRRFKNGVGGGNGGGATITLTAEEQQAGNKKARSLILAALGYHKSLENVDFELHTFRVTPNHYSSVRGQIESRNIQVWYDPNLWDHAKYDIDGDTIYVGQFSSADQDAIRALLIHECTHAAMDMYCTQINDMVSEMCAYVAQMLYYQARQPSANAPFTGDPAEDQIFRPAWRYAKFFTDLHKGLAEDNWENWVKATKALTEMAVAIMAHAAYKDQFDESEKNNNGVAGYNGVGGSCHENPDAE